MLNKSKKIKIRFKDINFSILLNIVVVFIFYSMWFFFFTSSEFLHLNNAMDLRYARMAIHQTIFHKYSMSQTCVATMEFWIYQMYHYNSGKNHDVFWTFSKHIVMQGTPHYWMIWPFCQQRDFCVCSWPIKSLICDQFQHLWSLA